MNDTPLSTHSCMACGDPIAARQERIGEAMILLDALVTGYDASGELSPLYCPACLGDVLELDEHEARMQAMRNALREIDTMPGKAVS